MSAASFKILSLILSVLSLPFCVQLPLLGKPFKFNQVQVLFLVLFSLFQKMCQKLIFLFFIIISFFNWGMFALQLCVGFLPYKVSVNHICVYTPSILNLCPTNPHPSGSSRLTRISPCYTVTMHHCAFYIWSCVYFHATKTPQSPLDCKEIQPVHSEGDQSWVFIGRNDAKAETPGLWPPHVKS